MYRRFPDYDHDRFNWSPLDTFSNLPKKIAFVLTGRQRNEFGSNYKWPNDGMREAVAANLLGAFKVAMSVCCVAAFAMGAFMPALITAGLFLSSYAGEVYLAHKSHKKRCRAHWEADMDSEYGIGPDHRMMPLRLPTTGLIPPLIPWAYHH